MNTYGLRRSLMTMCYLCEPILLFHAAAGAQTVTPIALGLGTPTAGAVLAGTAVNPT